MKTTGAPKSMAFYVSANEVAVSEREADRYQIYRVFNFGVAPRMYALAGALSRVCELSATVYRARVAGSTESRERV